MSKIKQSSAIQRQIPEHIRENYPAFVEFIKSYYDFLEQTQSQNLEQIKDIDTTLDEFIFHFKDELARNVPIELAGDKRLLLKNLRQFYLSRGSEASFKFLFSALFDKQASLFYPSTQILRVSDGKWVQEVSVFVRLTNGTSDFSKAKGKFVTINTGKKTLTTYVSAVNQYSNILFEVFIENQFASTIVVGSDVSFIEDGVTYTGTTLKCPTGVNIYKAGKGFRVGDLFNLKTQLGRGCLIKITRVDSEGAIQAVQLLRFGLDYQTTFYSYLSSKNLEALEYVHPIQPGEYIPGAPAYNERSGGFIDYGWAAKQTYMDYDATIPVGSPDRRSDRYFADPSYVGDLEAQFFAEDIQNPIDEDLAIIKVNLGAVARYPGYYMAADGFISDEIYIQDGNYYQSFSYVIKVEEELRKYADIVKALVHPSGMKMFAEYEIYKELKLSAVSTILSNKLQLPLDSNPPSNAIITDGGFAYNQYVGALINNQPVYQPAPGASRVFKQGRPSLFPSKKIADRATASVTSRRKGYTKNLKESLVELDLIVKHVLKPIANSVSTNLDIVRKSYTKNKTDSITHLETKTKSMSKPLFDSALMRDSSTKAFFKNLRENISEPDSNVKHIQKANSEIVNNLDLIQKLLDKYIINSSNAVDAKKLSVIKNIAENITEQDFYSIHFYKNLRDNIENCIDVIEKLYEKPIADVVSSKQTLFIKEYLKNLNELIGAEDENYSQYDKNLSEEQIVLHYIEKDIASLKEDSLNLLHQYEYLFDKNVSDDVSYYENSFKDIEKNVYEILDSLDEKYKAFEKNITETITYKETQSKDFVKGAIDEILDANDQATSLSSKPIDDELSIFDLVLITRLLLAEDYLLAQDNYSTEFAKVFADSIDSIGDVQYSLIDKVIEEPINTSMIGKLRDNPYDTADPFDGYFAYDEDYQPVTLLS